MRFVTAPKTGNSKRRQPALYVRRTFLVKEGLKKATLRITALGVYEGYLNGKRLGAQYLTPGYTDYNYRLQYQGYDVTRELVFGDNVLAAVVGDGWYRGAIGIGSDRNCYGKETALGFELQLSYQTGKQETIEADDKALVSRDGPLRENDLKVIEHYDARKEWPNWKTSDYGSVGWSAPRKLKYRGSVIPQEGELIFGHQSFHPKVLQTPNGETVLDFGQNHSGHVRFRVCGPAGHKVTLTMGETLDENRNFTMKNLVAEGAAFISGEVGQQLVYDLKEGEQTFEPLFLISGYRYVKVENWPEEVRPENFTSIAIYSAVKEIGTFECSNPLINKLVENSAWSRRSNFVDIPSDCPTRERAGWTGDINVYSETALYMADLRKFLEKWLEDFKLEQGKDGSLPYVVPDGGYSRFQRSCCGWSDALLNLTWNLYRFYGDTAILENNYDACKRFIEYQTKRAKNRNVLMTFSKDKAKGESRRLVIESGYHYGEWLEPTRPMYKDFIRNFFGPDTEVTTAWFYHSTKQLADMAEVLGKKKDEQRYRALAEDIRKAYRETFLTNPALASDRQCRLVRPLTMGLADEKERLELSAELAKRTRESGYTIGTGFLTTWKVLEALSNNSYIAEAYRLLENERCPGWLYEVKKGATTTWENWKGIDGNGKPVDSHNHFAPGAVVGWLFKHCAGIQAEKPGFAEVLIRPVVGGSLTFAKAEYQSVRGPILSFWKRNGTDFELTVTTPEGTPTTVVLPNGETHAMQGGTKTYHCSF